MTHLKTIARRLAAPVLSASLVAGALLSGGAAAQAHDHAAPVLTVSGTDFKFATPAVVAPGWTTLEFRNDGQAPHHVQIVRLPAGQTPEAFLAKLKESEAAALASVELIGGVGLLPPGAAQRVTLNLDAEGTYLELCFVADEKGTPHLALGMLNAFQVKGDTKAAPAALPQADLKVKLVDYGFELPKGAVITAGKQVWAVENAGPEGHEMLVFRLAPGKTLADVAAYLQKPEGAFPAIPMGGAQAVSRGRTSYVSLDLAQGEYFLLCAIPSPAKNGAPHAALGMMRPFQVVSKTASR